MAKETRSHPPSQGPGGTGNFGARTRRKPAWSRRTDATGLARELPRQETVEAKPDETCVVKETRIRQPSQRPPQARDCRARTRRKPAWPRRTAAADLDRDLPLRGLPTLNQTKTCVAKENRRHPPSQGTAPSRNFRSQTRRKPAQPRRTAATHLPRDLPGHSTAEPKPGGNLRGQGEPTPRTWPGNWPVEKLSSRNRAKPA